MEAINKQEFRIRELSTRSVLLFPTRAQIIRDIKNIALEPGQNQIIVDGLAPTVDEHSIKVEGTGAATISDVTVDLLPNREVFEDIYPSDSEEDDDDDDESEDELENDAIKAVNEKLKSLNVELGVVRETMSSALQRLQILDYVGSSVSTNRPPLGELDPLLSTYKDERVKIYSDRKQSTQTEDSIQKEIKKLNKEKLKLAKELLKAQEKAKKEKLKLKEKALRKKAELYQEKLRIRAERESFWPKKVYRVTINLELSAETPGSSRRSSIAGDTITDVNPPSNNLASTTFHEPGKVIPGEVSLSLSYITYSASWAPRYDLSLNSLKGTGTLDYGAELTNTTSEIWKDAKVILSTSQTTFSGLNETIPTLNPWHVRLQKGQRYGHQDALESAAELAAKSAQKNDLLSQSQKPRHEIFGVDNSVTEAYVTAENKKRRDKKEKEAAAAEAYVVATEVAPPKPIANAFPHAAGGLFGSAGHAIPFSTGVLPPPPAVSRAGAPPGADRYRALNAKSKTLSFQSQAIDEIIERGERLDSTISYLAAAPDPNSLVFEEGSWAEAGLTTTYDVPGLKTLAPSNSTIKHKIAKVHFSNVAFSHIIVPKLRDVAFLKASLRNASKITLLKGPVGLSLDGAFLGQATFPRCSAGASFTMSLGVDPAIQIAYAKPTVHRSQTGNFPFTKEDSNIFTRSIVVTNTKHNAPVELTVLDQVPISEDEKLRIEIRNPHSLKAGGSVVRTGANATETAAGATTSSAKTAAVAAPGAARAARASVHGEHSAKDVAKVNWGSAEASASAKGGEVSWSVRLNPGCAVRLSLEYEATFPNGEAVVNR